MKDQIKITCPAAAYPLFRSYSKRRQEHFMVLTLNGAHCAIRRHVVTKGLANRTMVHPREVFYPAIKDNAVAIIIAHNHPSNSLDPSNEDRVVTDRLIAAGEIMGIPVLDHMIICRDTYYSFLEAGVI